MSKTRARTGAVLIFLLCLFGCTQSEVVSNLKLVVTSAEVVLPLLSSQANLDPVVVGQIAGYLRVVNQAVDRAAPVLSSEALPARKSAQLAEIFATIAAPELPPGTPQNVLNAVATVSGAVDQFVAGIQTPKSLKKSSQAESVRPSSADLAEIDQIRKRAVRNLLIIGTP